MADFNLPASLATAYADVLDYLKARDLDAFKLADSGVTNPVSGMIRYLRASNKFQEYDGATWQDKVLSLAGGGTGATTGAGVRSAIGIGTIGTQDSNNVTITGGTAALASVSGSGSGLTNLNASNLASGTVPDARFPATLPALNGSALTALNASNLASGTVPDARFPATLPALNGSNLTALNASALSTGTVNHARLGSGGGGSSKFLREDNTWQTIGMIRHTEFVETTYDTDDGNANGFVDITLATALQNANKTFIVPHPPYTNQSISGIPGINIAVEGLGGTWEIMNGTTVRVRFKLGAIASVGGNIQIVYSAYVVEFL